MRDIYKPLRKKSVMRLEPGMLIRTNYSSEPYRIKSIQRGCASPSYIDSINMRNLPPSRPHINIVCSRPDGKGEFYLNRFDEETLLSMDKSYCGGKKELDHDWIMVLESDQVIQMTLF